MNYNIPHFRSFVKKSWFTKNVEDSNDFYNVVCFAIQSISDKILSFHCMTDHGLLRSRVPLSEIYFTTNISNDIPYHYKQLWNCFSETAHVIVYDFLKENRCKVVLKDKSIIWATYMMTIDWYDNAYSNEPQDYKCGHILKADNGFLLMQPNNRLLWSDSNWITNKVPQDLSIFKVDTELLNVENVSDRWIADDTDCYYYNMNRQENQHEN